MRRLKNEHEMFLKETSLIREEVWTRGLNGQLAHMQPSASPLWLLLGPQKCSLMHFVMMHMYVKESVNAV